MSKLILNSEPLNRVLENKSISKGEVLELFEKLQNKPDELFQTAETLRRKYKKNIVTFSKKVFFNLNNLCRDTCSYCTYKAEPDEAKLSMMSKDEVSSLITLAKKARCVEALFVTGERPEQSYTEARKWLRENGFSSTAEYLVHCSEMALKEGLFPHTNAGNLRRSELKELKKTNVSMGLMLENSSERLAQKDMPHHLAPSKYPKNRLEVLKNTGELGIPMTTGILVGIGENSSEIIESLYAIKELHNKYGNIQEIILQNFQPKADTVMKEHPSAEENYFKTIVATARIIMPEMNIQIPPNLSPKSYQSFLSVGINDWGGVSPITPDYVNPEFSWPEIARIEKNSKDAGYDLRCRFPIYPEFFSFIENHLRDKISAIENEEGLVKEEYWR